MPEILPARPVRLESASGAAAKALALFYNPNTETLEVELVRAGARVTRYVGAHELLPGERDALLDSLPAPSAFAVGSGHSRATGAPGIGQ